MRLVSFFTFSHLFFFAAAINSGTILNSDIDAFITNTLSEWNSPAGVAVAVVRQNDQGGWIVETKGYGNAKADGTKVTADSLFAIGSESKLFDTLATGLLISNQSLSTPISWTTKMATMIPEWELMDPIASAGSSIMDLMSHRTGLPRHDIMFGKNDALPAIISRLRYLKPSAEFRETFQYNNLMYEVLSYLPTVLLPHKPSLAQYVQENILNPLGMNSTTYSFARANATGKLVDSFAREGDATQNPLNRTVTHALPFWLQLGGDDGNFASGPGGVISSANDVATWLKMLISNGKNPATNATVIPASVLQTVTSGITVWPSDSYPELSPSNYGGGQYKSNYRGHDLIEHGGDIQGFHSMFTRFPFEGAAVAVLSNDDLYIPREIIRYRLMDELFALEPVDWDTRYKQLATGTALVRASMVNTPRSASATPPTAEFSSLVGKYSNPGYTEVELCQIVPPPSSASDSCKAIAKTLNSTSTFSSLVDPTVPTLVFTWDRVASEYVALAHFNKDIFNVTGWTGMPTGDAASPVWAFDARFAGTHAEFGSSNGTTGFGLLGGLWGPGAGVPDPKGDTAEERAEVWFSKGGANASAVSTKANAENENSAQANLIVGGSWALLPCLILGVVLHTSILTYF